MREAAGSKIDDLNSRLIGRLQKNILGLEIAVDKVLIPEVLESLEDLNRESADEVECNTFKVVVLDELVQVD